MRPCSAVLLTPLECAVPSRIPISIQDAPGNPLESALTSHSQPVENTATLSLLECALTRLSPATPLESALTKNRSGRVSLFWFRISPLTMCRSPQYSSSFFSHSCALFCALLHAAKNQVLSFQSIPHSFAQNHPGVSLLSPARSVLRGGGGVHRPACISLVFWDSAVKRGPVASHSHVFRLFQLSPVDRRSRSPRHYQPLLEPSPFASPGTSAIIPEHSHATQNPPSENL